MSSFGLAVDYGTSNTVAFLRWPDGRTRPLLFGDTPLLPSAVYLEDDGRLLTGRDAVRSARFDPARFVANPKRHLAEREVLLGHQVLPVVDLIAATLRTVWQEAGRTADTPPDEVTLTYPAAWAETRRALLRRAAERAGLPAPRLVAEPVAAATYFATVLGNQVPVGASVAVYDLGAGTFDVSVVRRDATGFTPIATDGLDGVGGLDLDAVVVELLRSGLPVEHETLWRRLQAPSSPAEQRAFRELWDGAREAKQALSRRTSATVEVPGVAEPQRVTRDEFESAAAPILAGTVQRTVLAIGSASAAGGDPVGLFLVGGSTRVPLVAAMLHRAAGIPPTVLEQPELVVAEGALHVAAVPRVATPAPVSPLPMPVSPMPVSPPPMPVSPPPMPVSPPPMPVSSPPVPAEPPPGRRRRLTAVLAALLTVALVATAVVLWQTLPGLGGTPDKDRGTVPSGQSQVAALGSVSAVATPSTLASSTTPSATARGTTATRTQPAGPVTVTMRLVIVRSTYNSVCPPPNGKPIELYGEITATGPVTVQYYWRPDPAWDTEPRPGTLTFTSAGTKRTAGFFGGWSDPGVTISYWAKLVVTAPTAWESQQVTWTTTCSP